MDTLHVIILGIVEGITEFLPISSTGHLILTQRILGISPSAFSKSFDIVIQLGAILAVPFLFPRRFLDPATLMKLAVGFIPTGIIGFLFYNLVKAHLLGNATVVVWALGIGGAFLIILELFHAESGGGAATIDDISLPQAVAIGLAQSIAIVPGVSRSGAAIAGGLLLGIRRAAIAEFSFLLALPVMFAASAFDIYKNYSSFSTANAGALIVGFFVSFLVALGSIRFLMGYIRRHSFIPFGIYRIALALIFFRAML